MGTIDKFDGEFSFLSNFYPTPIEMDGIVYPSLEHAFQAAKSDDQEYREYVSKLTSPGKAKRAGREVRLRENWDIIKKEVMLQLLMKKFSNPDLCLKLLATGDSVLIEGNWWKDTFWGVCNGVGENHLGKLLMHVRSEIRKHVGAEY